MLRAYQLTLQQVADAVAKNSLITTGGAIKTNIEEYLIRANHRADYAQDLENIIIKSEANGNIVRLKEVAEIRDRCNETPNSWAYNAKSAVRIVVNSTNSEDLLSIADKTKKYITAYNEKNTVIQLDIIADSSITLNQRADLLFKNGWQGILLVLIILSLFLKPRLEIGRAHV